MNQIHASLANTTIVDDDTALAATLKAAGDPLRLEILRLLARDSFGVMELARIFDIKQSGMSHHLKVLANAELVATRREGNSIFYRRALPEIESPRSDLLESLFAAIDQGRCAEAVTTNLSQIKQERAQASELFFTSNADKFRAQQDLIASYPVYADAVQELLDRVDIPQRHRALEIGPGEGDFLPTLAERFDRVVALDTSPELLQKAKQCCQQAGVNNLDYIQGNTHSALHLTGTIDCAVINMVLHHVASPAEVFDHLGQLLAPGGSALVTDLCHHDQQWAREACGDLWLGFDPDELTRWAAHAGLQAGASQYIALRNGFQIQLRQFLRPLQGEVINQEA